MKKKKEKTKLTAAERKKLRQPKGYIKKQDNENSAAIPEDNQNTVFGIKKKNFFFISVAIILAATAIVLAIILPQFIEPYGDYENPIAVFTMADGTKLEYEIYENDCPYAATNFIYLANKGYFTGAIIYDIQEGFVRFGGFRNESYNHRSTEDVFLKTLTDITLPNNSYTTTKLQYRIKNDLNAVSKHSTEKGYLSFMQNTSSGEFQFCAVDGGSLEAQNSNSTQRKTFNAVSFGRYLNIETLNKIEALYHNNENNVKLPESQYYYWLPQNIIKIRTVKIYNLDGAKWKNFNYDEYLTNEKHLSSWSYIAY